MKNQAFTLIELLVVVLIIGILAAIAVPKYQLAVDKADFRKYQAMAHSLEAAYDDYYLANGKATKNFSDLVVSLPKDFIPSYTVGGIKCMSNNVMFCCMSSSSSSYSSIINCGKLDLSVIYVKSYFGLNYSQRSRKGRCLAQVGNTRANRLCATLGTKGSTTNIWTPAGFNNTYQSYTLN